MPVRWPRPSWVHKNRPPHCRASATSGAGFRPGCFAAPPRKPRWTTSGAWPPTGPWSASSGSGGSGRRPTPEPKPPLEAVLPETPCGEGGGGPAPLERARRTGPPGRAAGGDRAHDAGLLHARIAPRSRARRGGPIRCSWRGSPARSSADRLIHAWDARNPRFHAETRARAERDLCSCALRRRPRGDRHRLHRHGGRRDRPRPPSRPGGRASAQASRPRFRTSTQPRSRRSPSRRRASRADDTWTPTPAGTPTKRWFHTAVWTGTQMLASTEPRQHGRPLQPVHRLLGLHRPDPRPSSRRDVHAAVWTGTRMIVWGGRDTSGATPSTPADATIRSPHGPTPPVLGAPAERIPKVAVWTGEPDDRVGREHPPGSGGQYYPCRRLDGDVVLLATAARGPRGCGPAPTRAPAGARAPPPAANAWSPIGRGRARGADGPHRRLDRVAHEIVWCQIGELARNDGGVYDPAANTWSETSLVGAPSFRGHHTAAWVQNRMVIWAVTTIPVRRRPRCRRAAATTPSRTPGAPPPSAPPWPPGRPERVVGLQVFVTGS